MIMTRFFSFLFFDEDGIENSLPKATSASMNFALPSLASHEKKNYVARTVGANVEIGFPNMRGEREREHMRANKPVALSLPTPPQALELYL
jgi:hypothetical protein